MSDPAILLRKLATLREHTARLKRRRPPGPDALRDDIDLQDAIAMSLCVSVQSALEVALRVALHGALHGALHVAAEQGAGVPATYADGFRMLADLGWIDGDTARRLAGMAALRNRIAHGYATVDHERIWSELPVRVAALDELATVVAARLANG